MRAISSWKLAMRQRRAGELLPSKAPAEPGGLTQTGLAARDGARPSRPVWRRSQAYVLSRLLLELFRSLCAAANLDLARPHSFRDLPNKLDREQPIDQISAHHFDVIR